MTLAERIFGSAVEDVWPARRPDHHPDGRAGQAHQQPLWDNEDDR